jgi:hypothetical protein
VYHDYFYFEKISTAFCFYAFVNILNLFWWAGHKYAELNFRVTYENKWPFANIHTHNMCVYICIAEK